MLELRQSKFTGRIISTLKYSWQEKPVWTIQTWGVSCPLLTETKRKRNKCLQQFRGAANTLSTHLSQPRRRLGSCSSRFAGEFAIDCATCRSSSKTRHRSERLSGPKMLGNLFQGAKMVTPVGNLDLFPKWGIAEETLVLNGIEVICIDSWYVLAKWVNSSHTHIYCWGWWDN